MKISSLTPDEALFRDTHLHIGSAAGKTFLEGLVDLLSEYQVNGTDSRNRDWPAICTFADRLWTRLKVVVSRTVLQLEESQSLPQAPVQLIIKRFFNTLLV